MGDDDGQNRNRHDVTRIASESGHPKIIDITRVYQWALTKFRKKDEKKKLRSKRVVFEPPDRPRFVIADLVTPKEKSQ
jgi:hypothetical protein